MAWSKHYYSHKHLELDSLFDNLGDIVQAGFHFWREHKLSFIAYCLVEDAKRHPNRLCFCQQLCNDSRVIFCKGEGLEALKEVTKGTDFDPGVDGFIVINKFSEFLHRNGCNYLFKVCDAMFSYWVVEAYVQPGFFNTKCRSKQLLAVVDAMEIVTSFFSTENKRERSAASHMLCLLLAQAFRIYDTSTNTNDNILAIDSLKFDGKVPEEKMKTLEENWIRAIRSYHRCDSCYNQSTDSNLITLKECGRCGHIRYCSAACQREDWALHKKVCKSPKVERLQQRKTNKMCIDSDVDD